MLSRTFDRIRVNGTGILVSRGTLRLFVTVPTMRFSTNDRPIKSEFFKLPVQLEPIG